MIKSFGDKETEGFFVTGKSRRIPPEIWKVALRKLDMIDAAVVLGDLRVPPGNRLKALRGDLRGYHSIRINDQWRIIFRWEDGNAYEVRIDDYHG